MIWQLLKWKEIDECEMECEDLRQRNDQIRRIVFYHEMGD